MTLDGEKYTLYTLISSGLLEVKGYENVRYWMCGGGSAGNSVTSGVESEEWSYIASGAGGGGGYVYSTTLPDGKYTVTIGSGGTNHNTGGGTTQIVKAVTAEVIGKAAGGQGANGGSGGGSFYRVYDGTSGGAFSGYGKGAGVKTAPFGITSLKYHSAGGGGGYYKNWGTPGDGGSNGSDGKSGYMDGKGGDYGGGSTSRTTGVNTSATFYGGGGAGAALGGAALGKGYQGVAYVLVPAA